jgi:hypothetical protein
MVIRFKILLIVFSFLSMPFAGKKTIHSITHQYRISIDTMPNVCTVLPEQDINALDIFGSGPITSSYPEPDPLEGFHGCYYEYNSVPRRYAALGVQLLRMGTKEEANDVFRNSEEDHHRVWLVFPERIPHVGDSASITMNSGCSDKCSECILVVKVGVHVIFVNFKGPEDTPRSKLKTAGLRIVQMMFDRIPGLRL